MKIVLVGAGEVGFNVAATLSEEGHDVNVVEQDEERATKAEDELNVRVVRGNGARPQVLYEAGIRDGCDVDFLVACANRDEVNILACWIGKRAGVKRVIARARGLEFTDSPVWAQDLGIDMMISPERSVAREILELLSVSTAVHTAELLGGRAAIYAFRVAPGSPLTDLSLKEFRMANPGLIAIVVYVERPEEGSVVPNGDTVLREGDLCYVVSYREQVWKLEKLFQLRASRPLRRVFIVGGGKLGFQVAHGLEMNYRDVDVRLIDRDKAHCERLASELRNVLVLNGDGADEALLSQEGIADADGYVCATDSDEVNLIYGALAKSMGAHKSVAVVRRKLYMDRSGCIPIDAVVDPNEAMTAVILRYIRYPGSSKALSIIEKIDAEMLEIVMPEGHALLDVPLAQLKVPKGVLLALVGRKKKVFVPDGSTCLKDGDHVILFASTTQMRLAAEIFG
ncbi:MAG: Trk system potassium transporter TrkA [Synergistaceae bacterium]|jgi:trk system potassium uptake protein TrkA|nr:Trk system potassium transporter TrkA [Synergistaceae bacterium]